MQRVLKFFLVVLARACTHHQFGAASRVIVYEVGNVIDFSIEYYPAVLKVSVRSYLCPGEGRSSALRFLSLRIVLLLLGLDSFCTRFRYFLLFVHLSKCLGNVVIVIIVIHSSMLGFLLNRLLSGRSLCNRLLRSLTLILLNNYSRLLLHDRSWLLLGYRWTLYI